MPDDKRRAIAAEWARTAEESTADAYPGAWWSRTLAGVARMESDVEGLRLVVGPVDSRRYSNAQLDDYSGVTEQRAAGTRWRPPLRLRLRARMSHTPAPPQRERDQGLPGLRGTAGFGFWNAPLTLAGGPPRAPEAVWFFAASPPSNMALVPGVPGFGWKAQVVHAQRPGALIAAAPLAATALWARVTRDEGPAGRWLQRLSGAREAALAPGWVDPRAWHDYEIEWRADEARFRVDGHDALAALRPPSGPLGFVLWIDTQYAVATPRGSLRFGALDASEQWLQVARLSIEPL